MLRASLLCVGMIVLAAALFTVHTSPASAGSGPPPSQADLIISWPGDTNCDDDIDSSDALVLLQYLVRLLPFENCLRSSDVTCDGLRDAFDVLALLRHTVALQVTRPAGCPPIGARSRYQFGPGITGHEQDLAHNAVAVTSIFLEQNFGVSTDIFSIVIDADLDDLAAAYAQNANIPFASAHDTLAVRGAVSSQTAVFIYKGHTIWADAPSDFVRQGIIVHEFFHIFQNELVGLPGLIREPDNQTPFGGPRWLIEGSATWAQSIVIFGSKTLMNCQQLAATQPLSTMESWTGMKTDPNSHALGSFAVDFITDELGTKGLADFWFHIGEGMTWQASFAAAFDSTIADFYASFAAYRIAYCP